MADLQDISEYIRISKDAMELMKSAVGLLPKGAEKDEAEQKLRAADEALQRSDARLAQDLGYKLCQCRFPPQIMLSQGYHETHNVEIYKCPGCGKQDPSEHKIGQLDRVKAHNEGAGRRSWTSARRGR